MLCICVYMNYKIRKKKCTTKCLIEKEEKIESSKHQGIKIILEALRIRLELRNMTLKERFERQGKRYKTIQQVTKNQKRSQVEISHGGLEEARDDGRVVEQIEGCDGEESEGEGE